MNAENAVEEELSRRLQRLRQLTALSSSSFNVTDATSFKVFSCSSLSLSSACPTSTAAFFSATSPNPPKAFAPAPPPSSYSPEEMNTTVREQWDRTRCHVACHYATILARRLFYFSIDVFPLTLVLSPSRPFHKDEDHNDQSPENNRRNPTARESRPSSK